MQLTTHAIFDGPDRFGMMVQLGQGRAITTAPDSELAKSFP